MLSDKHVVLHVKISTSRVLEWAFFRAALIETEILKSYLKRRR